MVAPKGKVDGGGGGSPPRVVEGTPKGKVVAVVSITTGTAVVLAVLVVLVPIGRVEVVEEGVVVVLAEEVVVGAATRTRLAWAATGHTLPGHVRSSV